MDMTLGPASFSSSLSLSASESVDLEVVAEIIERAPRDATSFPQVYRAYGEVLDEHGLSASADTAYYQFLLKLGVLRAPTWGERWDHYLALNTPTLHPAYASPLNHRSPLPKRLRSSLAAVRARVPYLDDASSDLDEAYGHESETAVSVVDDGAKQQDDTNDSSASYAMGHDEDDDDAEVDEGDSHPDSHVRRHRHRSRSLVGHTPSASDTEDDFEPPLRTSTPVQRAPPSYHVSNISRTLGRLVLEEKDASVFANTTATDASADETQPAYDSDDDSDDDPVMVQLERHADAFYQTGMLGRCFAVWHRSASWITRTTAQIDAVRDDIMLRQTWDTWQQRNTRCLAMAGTAQQHRDAWAAQQALDTWITKVKGRRLGRQEQTWQAVRADQTLQRTWKGWRSAIVARRTRRWRQDLAQREAAAMAKRECSLVENAMLTWRDAYLHRAAEIYHGQKTLRAIFDAWQESADSQQLLRGKLSVWEQRHGKDELRRCFAAWRKQTTLAPLAREVELLHARADVGAAWNRWVADMRRHRQAASLDEKRVGRSALLTWLAALRTVKTMQRKALRLADGRDRKVLGAAMAAWVVSERAVLLGRVHDTRLLGRSLAKWQQRQQVVTALNAKASAFVAASSQTALHNGLSRWRDRLGRLRSASLNADLVYKTHAAATAMRKWTTSVRQARRDEMVADKARAFFVLRTTLSIWRIQAARQKQAAYAEERRLAELRQWFDDMAAVSQRDAADVATFQRKTDLNAMETALAKWTERVVDVKARELDVVEGRDSGLIAHALDRWIRAARQQSDRLALLQSMLDVKAEDTCRRFFVAWAERARDARDRRDRLVQFEAARDARRVSSAFAAWYERKRARELAPVHDEVAARHEDALLFSVFDTWQARTPRVRAIQRHNARVAAEVLAAWVRALRRRARERELRAREDARLAREVLLLWRSKAAARLASKPTRRGRVRPVAAEVRVPLPLATPRPRAAVGERRRATEPVSSSAIPTRPASAYSAAPYARGVPPRAAASLYSEPAYDRLRGELSRRAGSEEPVSASRSPLVGALRKGLRQ